MELLLAALADGIFGALFGALLEDASERHLINRLRDKVRGQPQETQALLRALKLTYEQFKNKFPELAHSFFDEHFLKNVAISQELAKLLTPTGQPDIETIERVWQAQLPNINHSIRKEIQSFIDDLTQAIGDQPELHPFIDSRAFQAVLGKFKEQVDTSQASLRVLEKIEKNTKPPRKKRSNKTQAEQSLTSESLPPLKPAGVPRIDGFVGREPELDRYRQQLESTHIASITGMPGVGKTWLAANLAQQSYKAEKTFWYRCSPEDDIYALIWEMASFLAYHGKTNLWRILSASRFNAQPPLNVLFGYLFQEFAGLDLLLCFDDLHNLLERPGYARFGECIRQAVQNREVHVVVMSRQSIDFVPRDQSVPLIGLTIEDVRKLLTGQNVQLTEPLLSQLYERTEGNAELLMLATHALHRKNDPIGVVHGLVSEPDIKHYLLKQIDEQLSDEKRLVMQGVAALLEWTGTADEIEEVLDSQNVRRILTYLSNRYLLEEQQRKDEIEYDAHAVIKSYYYDSLSKRQRQKLHLRAAQLYANKEPGTFKVALHYLRAEWYEQAAQAATDDAYRHLYSGHSKTLLDLLEMCAKQPLPEELVVKVLLAIGDVHAFNQQHKPAEDAYQRALTHLDTLPASPASQKFRVQAHRDLGFLYRSAQPAKAMKWLQDGLTILNGVDPIQEADLQIQIGDIYLRLGEHEAAYTALTNGLSLLPRTPSRLRLLALINLGRYHYYQNALTACSDIFDKALSMAKQLQDPFNRLAMTVNLANLKQTTGDWTAAHELYTQAEQLATELGDQEEKANVALNWGVLFLHQGKLEQATTQLAAALERSRQCNLHDLMILALAYWAELQMMEQALDVAQRTLVEVEPLMTDYHIEFIAPFVKIIHARYFLLVGNPTTAQDYAKQAIDSARTQGMKQEEGQALRILAQIQLALQQYQAAIECCDQSHALLATIPYERAYTQVVTGQAWLALGDVEQGRQWLQTALTTFRQVGAGQDVKKVQSLIC